MLTFAMQTFADGRSTLTPEEPATLALILAGVGTIALYMALTHRRVRAATVASEKKSSVSKHSQRPPRDNRRRRAA